MTPLPDNLCRREYINPMWLDIASLLVVAVTIYLLSRLVPGKGR